MDIQDTDTSPPTEAEGLIEQLNEVMETAKTQVAIDIARLIEAIEADPDDDELWEQAQQFLKGYDA